MFTLEKRAGDGVNMFTHLTLCRNFDTLKSRQERKDEEERIKVSI
jgi:hypothetical protein